MATNSRSGRKAKKRKVKIYGDGFGREYWNTGSQLSGQFWRPQPPSRVKVTRYRDGVPVVQTPRGAKRQQSYASGCMRPLFDRSTAARTMRATRYGKSL